MVRAINPANRQTWTNDANRFGPVYGARANTEVISGWFKC